MVFVCWNPLPPLPSNSEWNENKKNKVLIAVILFLMVREDFFIIVTSPGTGGRVVGQGGIWANQALDIFGEFATMFFWQIRKCLCGWSVAVNAESLCSSVPLSH